MKKLYIIASVALVLGGLSSCSKEKECKCYLPNNEVSYETAEECKFLNQVEIYNGREIVIKYCLEE
jgi:hypothetical protein